MTIMGTCEKNARFAPVNYYLRLILRIAAASGNVNQHRTGHLCSGGILSPAFTLLHKLH